MVMPAAGSGSISFDEPFRGHDAFLNGVSEDTRAPQATRDGAQYRAVQARRLRRGAA